MRINILFLFLLLLPLAARAQCYQTYVDEGKRLARAGQYDAAIK